jgi:lysyl-tRNA synthetase class 2
MRNFLIQRGFIEVETPMLQVIPGGASAKPFITRYIALDQDMYLRIAPELFLKRLIIGGFEKVFEINRNFRNEGISTKHNPEFTMLEAYWAYADYDDVMNLTENLIQSLVNSVLESPEVEYKGKLINFKSPYKKIKFDEALKEYAGISVSDIRDATDLKALLNNLQIKMEKPVTIGNVINEIFDKKVEINFIQPTFVYDFPIEISPLAKRTEYDPHMVYRFEIFIGGLEIGNAFSELNDPLDQYERFKDQLEAKNKGEEETQEMDMDYIEAMEYGLPPTGGLGIGIDRLVMLLTGKDSIREVILFPQLKKKGIDEEEE